MPVLHETFPDRASANHCIEDLIAAGISADDISILMTNATPDHLDQDLTTGAVAGGVGGGIAAIAGGLILGGALTLATAGAAAPLLIAGPLAGAFAGGVSGLAVGALAGGLAGAGVAEADAHTIETNVRNGCVVVAVRATTQNAPDVDQVLRRDDRGTEPTTTA
jgi:hypothetical protein